MGVYKVFNSNVLTFLFYKVYLCFIFDLRRGKNINVHILDNSSFLLDVLNRHFFIISQRLYYTSFTFSKGFAP